MAIWTTEIKEIERLYESFKGQLPDLEKELEQLIRTEDANVIMLYSRRCLEVIITDLCECELKRPRKTEPLKGIIDKLHKEGKVPSHIITSMHGLNELSTYGTHPKDFDPEQVKPVLNNLDIIIKWYLKYKETGTGIKAKPVKEIKQDVKSTADAKKGIVIPKKRLIGLISGLMLFAVIVVAALFLFNIIGIGKQTKDLEKSIAVLPFINDSPNDSNQYFINGFMEDVLNHLQTIKDLHPISRTSAEKYRKTTKSIPEIAKELSVNYIVEGDMQRYGNSIRLSVNLFKVLKKELKLWGKTYEKKISDATDIFSLQSQIAESIAAELEAAISPQEKQTIEKISTKDLEAYDAYTEGEFYWRKLTPNDLETALKYFELAKERDPNYALAYAGICDLWVGRQQMGITSPAEARPKIIEAARKAIELDSTSAEVHYSLALMNTWTMWDWEKGEDEFKKTIEINPNHAEAHEYYAHLLANLGRNQEALKQSEVALNLDPLNALIKALHGIVLTCVHKYDEAVKAFQDALKIEPNYPFASGNFGNVLELSRKYKEALEQYKLANVNDTELVNALEKGYIEGGFKGSQLSYAKVVELRFKNSYWLPCDIAMTYAGVGEKDKALYWLGQAYKLHDPNLPYLLYPLYEKLYDDSRFKNLCHKMKLPYK